ncbi:MULTISPECIES: 30S ribosomal protein S4 [Caproicibacterium]|jgi:small subunit ribosomal protein S4|uniref:Small ribosomal subunit protein uS4 n=1 Tax=Caproicibacterium lactatifermentans TaxID=2666138 RepID=A0ABX6PUP1_9FIRM|nr:30S ribosomal protein S4 [Caproicibacterium lactatifermentans]ARP50933.1 30S ribosomal protein S4 [Ruminococcaceae bacterium CPB6]MDD4807612.1 30S ribosomal protein S4 [Oscillospiraceae bacterium]QKO29980.1 30S ribosomal protein S4 [Caproicibacterium lactatifermentans]
MARNMQPVLKRCKTLGISPAVMGINKNSIRNPKQGRRKQSEYATQLNEKQKAKFIYGVQERQFRHYYKMATNTTGVTGENLLRLLERRLDNVVYRLGFANTRREARQMVTHGHITVNGKRLDICSALVKVGDVVSIAEKSRSSQHVKDILEKNAATAVPKWLQINHDKVEGTVLAMPERSDIDFDINETLIVELYSK